MDPIYLDVKNTIRAMFSPSNGGEPSRGEDIAECLIDVEGDIARATRLSRGITMDRAVQNGILELLAEGWLKRTYPVGPPLYSRAIFFRNDDAPWPSKRVRTNTSTEGLKMALRAYFSPDWGRGTATCLAGVSDHFAGAGRMKIVAEMGEWSYAAGLLVQMGELSCDDGLYRGEF